MSTHQVSTFQCSGEAALELRFVARVRGRRPMAFPCDERGRVDMDALDERRRNDYLFARALMDRDYERPIVRPVALAS
jgi:hypothetical protein